MDNISNKFSPFTPNEILAQILSKKPVKNSLD